VDPDQPLQRSYLFTIRVWTEPLGAGRVERRGQAQYVLTGERCSFRDWLTLVAYLEAKLHELDGGAVASDASG
jgi:hypothetical protein